MCRTPIITISRNSRERVAQPKMSHNNNEQHPNMSHDCGTVSHQLLPEFAMTQAETCSRLCSSHWGSVGSWQSWQRARMVTRASPGCETVLFRDSSRSPCTVKTRKQHGRKTNSPLRLLILQWGLSLSKHCSRKYHLASK